MMSPIARPTTTATASRVMITPAIAIRAPSELPNMTRRIADPNPSGQTSHLAITTEYAYYPDGQLHTETIDPTDPDAAVELNRVTTYTYDDAGRIEGMELPNGGVFTYTYDGLGNRTSETDPLSRTTTYDYDIAGRLVVVTDPGGARI